jgi:hypothetical protein
MARESEDLVRKEDAMKKNTRKLTLNRESLRRLETPELRDLNAGAAAPPTFAVLACYSHVIPTCVCTGTGP